MHILWKKEQNSKILLSGSKHLDMYEFYAFSFAFWPCPFFCFLGCWLFFWLDAQLSFRKFLSSSSWEFPLPFLPYKSPVSRIPCLPFIWWSPLFLWRVSHSAGRFLKGDENWVGFEDCMNFPENTFPCKVRIWLLISIKEL